MTPAPAILILAAGASSRMRGADKLLMDVAGQPCLRVLTERALATGLPVYVALPPDRPARTEALHGLKVTQVVIPDAADGMGHSIRGGISALPDHVTGALILPADMPDIQTADLVHFTELHRTAPDLIWRATDAEDTMGHPVIFPKDLFSQLSELAGDDGAKSVVKRNLDRLKAVPLAGRRATLDLDTPEAWEAYYSGSLRGSKTSAPQD
ncbi:nucleotidyltransferase family protein [Donghicola eburneus]|nr:nucleotidyltransferase family protein [Donghicola eburneus]